MGIIVFGFQQTAITPSLPVVQDDLGASRQWTTWLLSGYFIVASVVSVLVELAVLGIGFGVAIAVMGSIIPLTTDIAETSVATSINSVLRRVGGAIGAQLGVALLGTVGGGSGAHPAEAGFTAAFAVAACAALVGAICTIFITPRRRSSIGSQHVAPDDV